MCSQARAEPHRDAPSPDAMPAALVDAHHHLWRLGAGARYPWLQEQYDPARFMFGDYAALCRDFDVDDYRHATQGAPIVASVHVEAERARDEALAETRWLHAVAAEHGLPSAVVAWVDLLADDAHERLAEQAAWPRVRGVRFKPRTAAAPDAVVDGPGTLRDPRWPAALERLAAQRLGWDLRVPFWHLGDAAALLADAPGVDVVLEHAGLPWDRSAAGLARWRRGMEALAASPRVTVKISELGLRDAMWSDVDNARIIRDTIAIFGWQRCMFASNFPVAGLRVSYSALLRTFARAMADLDDAARQAIWHDNALRVYRIS
ncbi:amidohydrolase [Burkholderia diffusa]|uniref:Amidohydrolase n=1 Tax=Burkholderia diffusa TaxID=488732 RepID=A0AAW3PFV8_9BURK|nr:amidohydrolase family protein [Burkholderia diffusa]AOI59150.1 amidohydrolase [Burkholderia diffusa]KVC23617.1 amidohydrolase [Burkholderia diffusa]KVC50099.1 amidohydrolase [Burkholderia diffusa]KVN00405.1 amidohydrolase [Burkholderia diffusa]KWF26968.1 amidohydrolase [Burkholderia diffusa]